MSWIDQLEQFCSQYNIPIDFLPNTLYEPKVIPMVRGKAFEFSVMLALKGILPSSEFMVEKTAQNAQLGSHDEDIVVIHLPSAKRIRIECKLSAKGSWHLPKGTTKSQIRVKCMRSRTLGPEMVERLYKERHVSKDALEIHNDQYLPSDFDFVVTSLANAFYQTDAQGLFQWQPTEKGITFLRQLGVSEGENLRDFAFSKMYLAYSGDLRIAEENGIKCTRKKCATPASCGFMPNYPIIHFETLSALPSHPWYSLDQAAERFQKFIVGEASP